MDAAKASPLDGIKVAGFFAGVGGLELGFDRLGAETKFLCENDLYAIRVLEEHFCGTRLHGDISSLARLPKVDAVLAGFPCQDLSAVGRRAGIAGERSGIVDTLFDLIEASPAKPKWIVLENVPFMLQLQRGQAMAHVIGRIEALGYAWAYRVVDTRAFGLPQRRRRVFILATRGRTNPADVLLAGDADPDNREPLPELARGFYWTEGNTGLGWAVDAIPTLKGGSALSIPSPPAMWMPDGRIVTPDIRDAERLQGFQPNWTKPAEGSPTMYERRRWRQVGNAVSVPVAEWLARNLAAPQGADPAVFAPLDTTVGWPSAAVGRKGERFAAKVGEWPRAVSAPHLHEFLHFDPFPLSKRAATGFYGRIIKSTLKVEPGFLDAMAATAGVDRIVPVDRSVPAPELDKPRRLAG
jgi:DNA (cytosine-5)-methyltransferase 1